MKRAVLAAPLAVVIVLAAWWVAARRTASDVALPVPGDDGAAVTVEVLNGTAIDGLARRVTRQLRRQGIDVVYFGTARSAPVPATLLLVRRGADSTLAHRVREALGIGHIVLDPDPRLLLDVSVLLGADAPVTLDFHP